MSTGNRFNKLDEDMKTMAENDAAVKEMEVMGKPLAPGDAFRWVDGMREGI